MQNIGSLIQNRAARKRDHRKGEDVSQRKAEYQAGDNQTKRDKTADCQNRT